MGQRLAQGEVQSIWRNGGEGDVVRDRGCAAEVEQPSADDRLHGSGRRVDVCRDVHIPARKGIDSVGGFSGKPFDRPDVAVSAMPVIGITLNDDPFGVDVGEPEGTAGPTVTSATLPRITEKEDPVRRGSPQPELNRLGTDRVDPDLPEVTDRARRVGVGALDWRKVCRFGGSDLWIEDDSHAFDQVFGDHRAAIVPPSVGVPLEGGRSHGNSYGCSRGRGRLLSWRPLTEGPLPGVIRLSVSHCKVKRGCQLEQRFGRILLTSRLFQQWYQRAVMTDRLVECPFRQCLVAGELEVMSGLFVVVRLEAVVGDQTIDAVEATSVVPLVPLGSAAMQRGTLRS